jgi:hypothetical protein
VGLKRRSVLRYRGAMTSGNTSRSPETSANLSDIFHRQNKLKKIINANSPKKLSEHLIIAAEGVDLEK